MQAKRLMKRWSVELLSLAMLLALAACATEATRSMPRLNAAIECGQSWEAPKLPPYPTGPNNIEAQDNAVLRAYSQRQQAWAAVAIAQYQAAREHAKGTRFCLNGYNAALIRP